MLDLSFLIFLKIFVWAANLHISQKWNLKYEIRIGLKEYDFKLEVSNNYKVRLLRQYQAFLTRVVLNKKKKSHVFHTLFVRNLY